MDNFLEKMLINIVNYTDKKGGVVFFGKPFTNRLAKEFKAKVQVSTANDFLPSNKASCFVLCFENFDCFTNLDGVHFSLYAKIRKHHPKTPIFFATSPACVYDNSSKDARNCVYRVYQRAKALGDKKVFFVGGELLFANDTMLGLVEKGVPTTLGVQTMVQNLTKALKRVLFSQSIALTKADNGLALIDKNFSQSLSDTDKVAWHDASKPPFDLYGVYYSQDYGDYRRYSPQVGDSVNLGFLVTSDNTTGGRIRFKTNSPYVYVKVNARIAEGIITGKGAMSNNYGFSLYANGKYMGIATAEYGDLDVENDNVDFTRKINLTLVNHSSEKDCILYLPLYGGARSIEIGVEEGCFVEHGNQYQYNKPVVFYGSSITQGGSATRAGCDYVNLLTQMLDCDVFNFSCSGSCRAEQSACDYLAQLSPSIYVIDYDHNAPSLEYLLNTHDNLYQTIRKVRKDTPIVFISRVNDEYAFECDVPTGRKRKDIIFATYKCALDNGDKNVYFVDGKSLFPEDLIERANCTIDTVHPNDVGFYYMAKNLAPLLKEILEKKQIIKI